MLVADTGVLLAPADTADPDHGASVEVLTSADGPLVTTWLVIAEGGYLIARQLGSAAEARFYRSVAADDFGVHAPTEDDLARMAELIEQYVDLDLGGTDASLIVLAERLGQRTIATLDRRHFAVVSGAHQCVRSHPIAPRIKACVGASDHRYEPRSWRRYGARFLVRGDSPVSAEVEGYIEILARDVIDVHRADFARAFEQGWVIRAAAASSGGCQPCS